MKKVNFSRNLKVLRTRKGLTQEDLGSICNVSRQTVTKWESGESQPDLDRITELCSIMEVSLEELVYGTIESSSEIEEVNKKVDELTKISIANMSKMDIIYSCSDNDYRQLIQEITLKNIEYDAFIGLATEWKDYQREFCDLLGFEKIISLESAMNAIGENFAGRMHDELWDARKTASIYALSKDIDEFNRIMKPIIEVMKPSAPMTFCLGDLFADKLKGMYIAS